MDDPRTRNRDLPIEALGPQWQTTLATMEVGDVSEPAPVQLLNGRRAYHIVLLQRRTPSHRVNVETDYEQLEQIALQDKQNTVLRQWLDELRSRVYVEGHPSRSDARMIGHVIALLAQRPDAAGPGGLPRPPCLDAAAKDDRIDAVVLDLDRFLGGGQVHLQSIGEALDRVRAAEKPVLAYATAYYDDSILLASHASEIWMDPQGGAIIAGPGGHEGRTVECPRPERLQHLRRRTSSPEEDGSVLGVECLETAEGRSRRPAGRGR